MRIHPGHGLLAQFSTISLAVFLLVPLHAFPPAPDHTFQGIVRNEFGHPIKGDDARVIFETSAGWRKSAPIILGLRPGINFELPVPMDAGATLAPYERGAQFKGVPFRMRVQIGSVSYVPIEMVGDFSHVGEPGRTTILNLTLGVDADGDGLPDAWEQAVIESRKLGGLSDIKPGDDTDGDGLSNLQEYLSGNYAFDSSSGLSLSITGINKGRPIMEFLTVRGRNYSVMGSSDLLTWEPIPFVISSSGTEVRPVTSFQSDKLQNLRVEVAEDFGARPKFFKVRVQ